MGRHVDNLRALDMPYYSPKRGSLIHRRAKVAAIEAMILSNPHGTARLLADVAAPIIDLRD